MDDLRARSGAGLRELVDWAVRTRSEDIPESVMRKAARILADDLGAMIGARDEPELAQFQQRLLARGTPVQEATVWRGGQARVERTQAAVLNAVAADWLELDEGYRPAPCHAGLYVLPALLAQAEASSLTCREMLRCLVLGYEIVTRIARSWSMAETTMQSHGRYAAVGAAAGTALAQGLGVDDMVSALGGAVTLIGPAPRNHLAEGVLIRNTWPSSGAWNGMMAVEWAQCGIGGIPEAVFDVYSTVLGGQAHPERLTQALGSQWAVLDGYTKIYACCQHLHSAVEAALELRAQHPELGELERIESVQVETHPLAMPLSNPRPTTTLGAKFSMPHAVAAAFRYGEAGAAAFAATTLAEPALRHLMPHIMSTAWSPALPPPHDRPARVTALLRDGRTLTAECLSAKGGPDRPLPENTWREKMLVLAQPAYPRIVDVFDEIVAGDAARLSQSWRDIAQDITRG